MGDFQVKALGTINMHTLKRLALGLNNKIRFCWCCWDTGMETMMAVQVAWLRVRCTMQCNPFPAVLRWDLASSTSKVTLTAIRSCLKTLASWSVPGAWLDVVILVST